MNLPMFTLLCLYLISLTTTVSLAQQEPPKRTTTVGMQPKLINMSRLLYIPPDLRQPSKSGRVAVTDLVDPSDTKLQQKLAKRLKKWAFDQLRCEGHVSKQQVQQEDKCFADMQPLHDSKPFASEEEVVIPKGACDSDFVHAWNILGATFQLTNEADNIQLGYLTFGKAACLQQALRCDPNYALAWYNAAQAIQQHPSESVPNPGIEFDLVDGDPTHNKKKKKNRTTSKYSRQECLVKTVENAPWHSEAWYHLGMTLKNPAVDFVYVKGKKYFKKDCYAESIKQNGKDGLASSVAPVWNNLGSALVASTLSNDNKIKIWDDEEPYSKFDCYREAVKADPQFSYAWYNLGALMQLDQTLDTTQLWPSSNNNNPSILSPTITKSMSKVQVLLEALRAAARKSSQEERSLRLSGLYWNNVGNALRPEDRIIADDVLIDEKGVGLKKQDCYIKALELDGSLSSAWNNLGSLLPLVEENPDDERDSELNKKTKARLNPGPAYRTHSSSSNNNKKYFSKKDCYIEALRHNKYFPAAWQNLGDILGLGLLVDKNGKVRTNSKNTGDLLSKTKSEATSRIRYHNVDEGQDEEELSLLASEVVEIEGKKYNKRRCFIEAIKLDPENDSYSWTELGVIASKEHKKYNSISISLPRYSSDESNTGYKQEEKDADVIKVTPKDCFVRAIRADKERLNFRAWYNLGVLLNSTAEEEVFENGQLFSSRDCFVQALKINPNHCASFVGLGNSLPSASSSSSSRFPIDISQTLRVESKRDSFIKGILCDKKNNYRLSAAWYNLALTMQGSRKNPTGKNIEKVLVGKLGSFTMKECFAKAVTGDPQSADGWYNLGLTLVLDETATISLTQLDTREEKTLKVDRKFCFEAYDAIVRGGGTEEGKNSLAQMLESAVGIEEEKEEPFEKFVDEEDDDF